MIDDRAILNRHLEYLDGLSRGQANTSVGNALKAMAEAREAERAAAVAWLREASTQPVPVNSDEALIWAAIKLESGDHLKDRPS